MHFGFSARGFLSNLASRKDGAMSRAEIGQVTLCQVSDGLDPASSQLPQLNVDH